MENSSALSILVVGAAGKMGRETVLAVLPEPDLQLVAAVDRNVAGQDIATALGQPKPCGVVAHGELAAALDHLKTQDDTSPAVGVEFTHPSSVFANACRMIDHGVMPLIGATGLSATQQQELDQRLKAVGLPGAFVPNFALGAVLLMKFAREASRYFPHAELIELHHNQKADAPSGTALWTADAMASSLAEGQRFGPTNAPEHETLAGSRGGETPAGLRIHSVRLPGLIAHQEVLFGAPGQLLTLRHDSLDRKGFMAGVLLAARGLPSRSPGLTVGLEAFL